MCSIKRKRSENYNFKLLQMVISMIKWLPSVFMTYERLHKDRKMRAMFLDGSGDHDDVPRVTLVLVVTTCAHWTLAPPIRAN